jgi:hypothetical protein
VGAHHRVPAVSWAVFSIDVETITMLLRQTVSIRSPFAGDKRASGVAPPCLLIAWPAREPATSTRASRNAVVAVLEVCRKFSD